jgi:hypothetical protein
MMSNKIMSSNDNNNNKLSSDYYYGFGLLLEAVEYHELSMNTSPPLCHHEKGGVVSNPTPSCTLAPTKQSQYVKVSYTYTNAGPPKKRFKMISIEEDTVNYGTQPRYNLSTTNITKSSFFKTPSNCPAGSSHRVWEGVDECVTAATSYHRLELVPSSSSTQVNKKQHMNSTTPPRQQDTKTFILYDEGDDKYINSVHNIIRRDIWEGFVVGDDDTVKDFGTITSQNQDMPAKSIGRLALVTKVLLAFAVGSVSMYHLVNVRRIQQCILVLLRISTLPIFASSVIILGEYTTAARRLLVSYSIRIYSHTSLDYVLFHTDNASSFQMISRTSMQGSRCTGVAEGSSIGCQVHSREVCQMENKVS